MRTRVLAVTAVAASGLLLAGCQPSSTVSTTAANTGGAKASAAAAPATTAAAAKAAGLGDTIDVTGETSGEKLAVTLVKVDPKAQSTDGFSSPPAGDAYFAAQIQIKNIGTAAYSDSADNCLAVKDGKGQQFQTDLISSVSSGPTMDQLNIAPGDTSLGWVVFDVPIGDAVAKVQFTEDSGMGGDTAQWSIG
jgi:hypothetical protein